ncbi:MAG: TetR/AcrR family transcriptional regulator [Clostridia bacterium]|nr:TetR/AcrR family transcriptional regulator [Clostridia bacterium]MBQ4587379.1 TetR/AcrR family transcriptional regulator [Clostridia bacterium]
MQSDKLSKAESKYYNTACLMNEALILLLEKKDYSFITVKEICEKAGVNRSTFYLHYETMDDLLSESIEYVGNKLHKKYSEKVLNKQIISSSKLEDLILITPEYLLPYLEFLKENKAIYKIAFSQPNVFKVDLVLKHLHKNIFGPILNKFAIPLNEQKYMMQFYLSGISSIIIEWIKNGCKENIQSIVSIIMKCLNLGDMSCLNRYK